MDILIKAFQLVGLAILIGAAIEYLVTGTFIIEDLALIVG